MKNLKYMSLMMAFACVLSLGFTSCGDNDDDSAPAPTIVMDEANIEKAIADGHRLAGKIKEDLCLQDEAQK